PRDLLDALEALERDHDYLALGGVFPKDLIRHWAELKRREALEVLARPHPYEFFLYGEYQNP
ncbi:TPA: type I glutamate--ammonia ligase, partial [Candidatus Micrarchaeota archaeon]|nr:type I glutamate--ammonia ligase [Candidatus Micrarchaeota archaeon]